MTIPEFRDQISGKIAAVLGVGVSNVPLIKFLLKCGATVHGFDARDKSEIADHDELVNLGAQFHLGENYLEILMNHITYTPLAKGGMSHSDRGDFFTRPDVIFKTPGIRPDIPELLAAAERNIEITSEMELFLKLCPAPIIGVTGSDGKTTTTTLIYEMLKTEYERSPKTARKPYIGGNIGTPLIAEIENITANDIIAFEMSSFQLYTMQQSPNIGIITNMTPNHLDWHTDMTEYINAKKNICGINSDRTKTVILNADNDITREIAADVRGKKNVIMFSKELLTAGVCIENGTIVRRENSATTEQFFNVSDIRLPGIHNVENFLTAVTATLGIVSSESTLHVAQTFGGVPHRIEFVREFDGVRYYNDSIATTPARARAGLNSFSNVGAISNRPQSLATAGKNHLIVIAGGYDKNIPFNEFGEILNARAKAVVLLGATAEAIEEAIKSAPNYTGELTVTRATTLEEATVKAKALTAPNDIVILSPACASFDMFKNFEVRGNKFKEIVNNL